jgi:preprotein translocase subunit SecA
VQVEAEEAPAPEPEQLVGAQPQLDLTKLAAAQEEHEHQHAPQISARGLGRAPEERPLTYTAPDLGSDAPSVQTSGGKQVSTDSATARRQQSRANPNRGSRGNRKRKR